MKSLDRLAEGEGDEPQPEAPCASGGGARIDRAPGSGVGAPSGKRKKTSGGCRRKVSAPGESARAEPDRVARPTGRAGDMIRRGQRRTFDESLKSLREAARFADNVRTLFGVHGPTAISDASLTRLQQLLTERLIGSGYDVNAVQLETDELVKLSKMVESAIDARHRLEQIRWKYEEAGRTVAREGDRIAPAGTDGELVVNRVKQLLGVPPGPETPEEAAAAERHFVPFDLAELENPSPAAGSPPESGAGAAVAPGL